MIKNTISQGSYAVIKSHKNGPFLTKAINSHKFSGFLFLLSSLQLKTQLFVFTHS